MKINILPIRQALIEIARNLKNRIQSSVKTAPTVVRAIIPIGILLTSMPAQSVAVASTNVNSAIVTNYDESVVNAETKQLTVTVGQSKYQLDKIEQAKKAAEVITIKVATVAMSDEDKVALVKRAAASVGIDWKILAAVWQIESGQQMYTAVKSYAGASGPCQFMPGTWRGYATDGDGNGTTDILDAHDCLFGAAKLLARNGADRGDITKALYSYNHSLAYVNRVKSIAESIK